MESGKVMDEVVVDTLIELSSLAISITIPVYPQPESTLIPRTSPMPNRSLGIMLAVL